MRVQIDDLKLMISGTALDAVAITSAFEGGVDTPIVALDVVVPRVRCAAGDRGRAKVTRLKVG